MSNNDSSSSDYRFVETDLDLILKPIMTVRDEETWPSGEAIFAYMYGSPTEAESREMQRALACSPSLQAALIDIFETNRWLTSNSAKAVIESTEVQPMPSIEKVIRRAIWKCRWEKGKTSLQLYARRLTESLTLKPLHNKLVLIPVAIVALILYFGFPQFGSQSPEYVTEMERAYFVSSSTKGAGLSDEGTVYPSADSAAMNEFQELVRFQVADKSFLFTPSLPSGRLDTGDEVRVRLRDEESGKEIECALSLPLNNLQGKESEVTLWILTTPDLNLWKYDLEDRTVTLDHDSKMGWNGVMTLTYKDADGYVAIPGVSF